MAFAENQLKLLDAKLPERHVKTRVQRGLTLSYIEGWHAIAEANRIFGFEGWDRETVAADCVWQDGRGQTKLCAYTAKVRIRVRAGEVVIQRDGSGVGQGSGATLGEAHESALKEAETDATKRALTTFGNLFGLALYDRDQAGVRRTPRPRDHSALVDDESAPWILLGVRGELVSNHDSAESYCTGLKRAIDHAVLPKSLKSLWYYNEPTIQRLRLARPELTTGKGVHYGDLLQRYSERARQRLAQGRSATPRPELIPPAPVDKSTLAIATTKRLRDPEHLRFINTQPCLICGRAPVHAHHLRFAQPRSMGNKVSDEWSVPLCFTHHRALHTVGDEAGWWAEKGIDARAEAQKLWRQSHGIPEPTEADTLATTASESDRAGAARRGTSADKQAPAVDPSVASVRAAAMAVGSPGAALVPETHLGECSSAWPSYPQSIIVPDNGQGAEAPRASRAAAE